MSTSNKKPAFTQSGDEALYSLQSSLDGLTQHEAKKRLEIYGRNTLPRAKSVGIGIVFLRQFASPLIYVLLAAAVVSVVIQEWSDAGFISAVLLINAIIGSIQEFSAQRAADALQQMVSARCRVTREGESFEINADELVPGDIVKLESGDKVPADIRLLRSHDLDADESPLTGESLAVAKNADSILTQDAFLGDRSNMLFAGTMIGRGRGVGVVILTALHTELGQIAAAVVGKGLTKAPLLRRMEKFTQWVAIVVGVAASLMAIISYIHGTPLDEIFLLAVALAVSAIPEGLPVALTVALAIGMRRMAKRDVIIRRLVAVESLGSCTFIATDKTGTLTVNQLTARRIMFPQGDIWKISGEGIEPKGSITAANNSPSASKLALLERLCLAAILPNDAFWGQRDNNWTQHGDAVDIAFLVMAHKAGIRKADSSIAFPELGVIPFESERLYSASLNQHKQQNCVFVKGALTTLLPMCDRMAHDDRDVALDSDLLESQVNLLAGQGYRVLALASGEVTSKMNHRFSDQQLTGLCLLGLVGMIDPLRPEAKAAIATCRKAGITVAMVTGDHPTTALAIAKELDLAQSTEELITGPMLKLAKNNDEFDQLTQNARVYARVEPQQKLAIVQSLQRQNHFVAVSGDGANDAPALRAAEVGVAMGKSGTDVARETADLIITDDNFSSIVAGVEEGRIAYANVRKVIFLLISTGASELVLFTLALLSGLPLPLLAVQLLWLNLVTNGIQDIALAFEPGEGNELQRPPRSPSEPIFNRLMLERVFISALYIGVLAFLMFQWFLSQDYTIDQARNATLLLMVLIENIHVFNSRSETLSVFLHNPLRNRILLFGTVAAQLTHIGAMYTPWLSNVLKVQPVSIQQWANLLVTAITVLIVMELHKLVRRWIDLRNTSIATKQ